MVDFLEYDASSEREGQVVSNCVPLKNVEKDVLEASVAMRSKMSLTNEFKMAIALFEIPVSGWTCLRTGKRDVRTKGHPQIGSEERVPL